MAHYGAGYFGKTRLAILAGPGVEDCLWAVLVTHDNLSWNGTFRLRFPQAFGAVMPAAAKGSSALGLEH